MKFKTTKKEIREGYYYIICIGYCNAQYLLKYVNPVAYSTRAEGWACDYYDIDGVVISTGYAPLAEKNTVRNYDLVKEYNDKAMEIACGDMHYELKPALVYTLLKEFIEKSKVVK